MERSLANGLELRAWWERVSATGNFEQRFPTALTLNRPDSSYAYFDHAVVNGKRIPIMGDMQEMFYDNTKIPRDAPPDHRQASVEWTRDQLQEYIMHYYSRTSSSDLPRYYEPGAPTPPAYLNPFGLCPRNETDKAGFGQKQLYYKLLDGGRVGKFPKDQELTIIDLREIGTKYEWMVGDARMFGFQFSFLPLGEQFPYGELPLRETQLAVISKDFIVNNTYPWDAAADDGIVGEFGYGLATLKIPYDTTIVGYGPGYFDQGFMTYTWRIMKTGSIKAHMEFCVNQPDIVLNPSLNPIAYGIKVADAVSFGMASDLLDKLPRAVRGALMDPVFGSIALANIATLGWAARDLNLSQAGVMKLFLYYHYLVIYTLVANSVSTWRQIPDWLDAAALPDWVVKGSG
ncbi:MAG TPA: hypothetical protein VHZ74_12460 [Bryobacteraceae bacterium]|nr:hypothetical protein [Bryobacteraceae bacterium]